MAISATILIPPLCPEAVEQSSTEAPTSLPQSPLPRLDKLEFRFTGNRCSGSQNSQADATCSDLASMSSTVTATVSCAAASDGSSVLVSPSTVMVGEAVVLEGSGGSPLPLEVRTGINARIVVAVVIRHGRTRRIPANTVASRASSISCIFFP